MWTDCQVGLAGHLVLRNAAKQMGHEGKGQRLQAPVLLLQASAGFELEGVHHRRGNATPLKHDGPVDTPRRARPSIGAADEHEITLREGVDDLRLRRAGDGLLALGHVDDTVALFEGARPG